MAENTNRNPRELESRAKTTRYVYVPSSSLPDPLPDANYRYRYIMTSINGMAQPTHVSKMMREGWEPVKAVDHPELLLEGSAKTGNVETGGLMLCKQAIDRVQARNEYYDQQAANQMTSVDNSFMRNNDPRMPLFSDRKSSTTRGGFGSGSK